MKRVLLKGLRLLLLGLGKLGSPVLTSVGSGLAKVCEKGADSIKKHLDKSEG